MNDFTLGTFRTWLRRTTEMAVDARCATGDVAVLLQEEASRLSQDGCAVGGSDDHVYELSSDDPASGTHDVLAQVIAGSFGGATVRSHDLELRHPGHELRASLWAVYDLESGDLVVWLTARTFCTTQELKDHLPELAHAECIELPFKIGIVASERSDRYRALRFRHVNERSRAATPDGE